MTPRPGRRGVRDRPWRVAGAGRRSCSQPVVGPPSGARPHVAPGPGNLPARRHPGARPFRSSTGLSRWTGSSLLCRKCPSPQSRRARNGQRRCPNSPPHWIPGVCMTGTYPPWPRPLPMLPTHSSGGPDGDSDQADERARRGNDRTLWRHCIGLCAVPDDRLGTCAGGSRPLTLWLDDVG